MEVRDADFRFRDPLPQSNPSQEFVLLELLAQGVAVDAEDFRGFALVALDVAHDDLEHGFFHLGDHHVVEITFQRLFYARGERRLAILGHAASPRACACTSKNSRTMASWASRVST